MRKAPAVLVASALALGLAACGDDDGGGDAAAYCTAWNRLTVDTPDEELAGFVEASPDTVPGAIEDANGVVLGAFEVGISEGDWSALVEDETLGAIGAVVAYCDDAGYPVPVSRGNTTSIAGLHDDEAALLEAMEGGRAP